MISSEMRLWMYHPLSRTYICADYGGVGNRSAVSSGIVAYEIDSKAMTLVRSKYHMDRMHSDLADNKGDVMIAGMRFGTLPSGKPGAFTAMEGALLKVASTRIPLQIVLTNSGFFMTRQANRSIVSDNGVVTLHEGILSGSRHMLKMADEASFVMGVMNAQTPRCVRSLVNRIVKSDNRDEMIDKILANYVSARQLVAVITDDDLREMGFSDSDRHCMAYLTTMMMWDGTLAGKYVKTKRGKKRKVV